MRMIPHWFCLLILFTTATTVVCQKSIRAKTEAGQEVILSEDGTWKYAVSTPPPPVEAPKRVAIGKTLYKVPNGGYGVLYDATKWSMKPEPDDAGRIEFRLKRGDAYGVLIIEELGMPLTTLREVAISNAKDAAPDAQIVQEEMKTINGKEVLMMKIDGTTKGIPFRFYGYYFSGKNGTIQLITYTGKSLFEKYEQEMVDLLSGFEIY